MAAAASTVKAASALANMKTLSSSSPVKTVPVLSVFPSKVASHKHTTTNFKTVSSAGTKWYVCIGVGSFNNADKTIITTVATAFGDSLCIPSNAPVHEVQARLQEYYEQLWTSDRRMPDYQDHSFRLYYSDGKCMVNKEANGSWLESMPLVYKPIQPPAKPNA